MSWCVYAPSLKASGWISFPWRMGIRCTSIPQGGMRASGRGSGPSYEFLSSVDLSG